MVDSRNNDINIEEKIEKLQALYDKSEKIVFFGGAGVSTESGIPDFRSQDGLYNQQWDYPPETIISHSFFVKNPKEFYRFYCEKMLLQNSLQPIKPNAAHFALAKMEENGKLIGVVTQNIDGLHQAAGSKKVFELHGSVHRNYCTNPNCHSFYDAEFIKSSQNSKEKIPICPKCGAIVKPDVVLYEEGLNDDIVDGAINAIAAADLLIIGGTSLSVYPAASFIRYYAGRDIVLINRDKTPFDSSASLVINSNIGKVLSRVRV